MQGGCTMLRSIHTKNNNYKVIYIRIQIYERYHSIYYKAMLGTTISLYLWSEWVNWHKAKYVDPYS